MLWVLNHSQKDRVTRVTQVARVANELTDYLNEVLIPRGD